MPGTSVPWYQAHVELLQQGLEPSPPLQERSIPTHDRSHATTVGDNRSIISRAPSAAAARPTVAANSPTGWVPSPASVRFVNDVLSGARLPPPPTSVYDRQQRVGILPAALPPERGRKRNQAAADGTTWLAPSSRDPVGSTLPSRPPWASAQPPPSQRATTALIRSTGPRQSLTVRSCLSGLLAATLRAVPRLMAAHLPPLARAFRRVHRLRRRPAPPPHLLFRASPSPGSP